MVQPKCPERGGNDFLFQRIFNEEQSISWQSELERLKEKGLNEKEIRNKKNRYYSDVFFSITYCSSCGYIVGCGGR